MFLGYRSMILSFFLTITFFSAFATEAYYNRLACAPKTDLASEQKPGFIKEIGKVNYGILSAAGSMMKLNQTAQQEIVATKNQNLDVCINGCHAVGEPIVDILTQPSGNSTSSLCPASYQAVKLTDAELASVENTASLTAYGVKRVFSFVGDQKICNEQASNWAKQVLTGNNNLGKFLSDEKCHSPCSYASNIRMVTIPNAAGTCATALEINVMCGPPRTAANWISTASLTNSYQCLPN